MTLNEWGLYKITIEKPGSRDDQERRPRRESKRRTRPSAAPVAAKTEIEVYDKLGLAYVPPELREDRGDVRSGRKERRCPD